MSSGRSFLRRQALDSCASGTLRHRNRHRKLKPIRVSPTTTIITITITILRPLVSLCRPPARKPAAVVTTQVGSHDAPLTSCFSSCPATSGRPATRIAPSLRMSAQSAPSFGLNRNPRSCRQPDACHAEQTCPPMRTRAHACMHVIVIVTASPTTPGRPPWTPATRPIEPQKGPGQVPKREGFRRSTPSALTNTGLAVPPPCLAAINLGFDLQTTPSNRARAPVFALPSQP